MSELSQLRIKLDAALDQEWSSLIDYVRDLGTDGFLQLRRDVQECSSADIVQWMQTKPDFWPTLQAMICLAMDEASVRRLAQDATELLDD